jgi:hypothetical protein
VRFRSFVSLCLMVCLSLSVWSQSQGPIGSEDRQRFKDERTTKAKNEVQKRGIGKRSKVKVTLQDQTEIKGYISQIDADSFQVTDKKSGQVRTISYQDARRIHRDGLSIAAKIAITAGLVAGAMIGLGVVLFAAYGD